MNRTELSQFNPELTLLGGQTFSWSKNNDFYIGVTQDKAIRLKYEQPYLYWQTYPQRDDYDLLQKYLRLDMDIEMELSSIDDSYLKSAYNEYKGLRLLNQEFSDTLISFLISQNKNITSIRQSVQYLSENYGDVLLVEGEKINLFPKIERLAELSEENLKPSKVGYRAPYIIEASRRIIRGDFDGIDSLDTQEQRELLLSIFGVGPKVADCILTFSLKVNDVTPVDTWGKKILENYYQLEITSNYDHLRNEFTRKFGDKTALAGHYLFEFARTDPRLQ